MEELERQLTEMLAEMSNARQRRAEKRNRLKDQALAFLVSTAHPALERVKLWVSGTTRYEMAFGRASADAPASGILSNKDGYALGVLVTGDWEGQWHYTLAVTVADVDAERFTVMRRTPPIEAGKIVEHLQESPFQAPRKVFAEIDQDDVIRDFTEAFGAFLAEAREADPPKPKPFQVRSY